MSQRVPSFSPFWNDLETVDDFSTMYNTDWDVFGFKANKFVGQDYQLDGLNCGGVPSRTTPTLTSVTPTTLRSIEQTFLDYQPDAESHQNEAGFVPPLLQSSTSVPTTSVSSAGGNVFMNIVDTKSWQGGTTTITEMPPLVHINSGNLSPPIPTPVLSMGSSNSSSGSSTSSNGSRKSIGGRRPNKENGISPEEEERRKLRRERNKLAAARCRKRRLDHTNELLEETQDLEGKKQRLHQEIQNLKMEKQELEFLLETHQSNCRLRDTDSPPDIKPFIMDSMMAEGLDSLPKSTAALQVVTTSCGETKIYTSMGIPVSVADRVAMSAPRQRPNSLPVSNSFVPKNKLGLEMAGIAISTPSNGLTLNFDSLMDGGTGLTPNTPSFIPSCSTQLRNSNVADLSSPESMPTKLVSL